MMYTDTTIDAIRTHEWTRRLPWHFLEMLASFAEERTYAAGDILFRERDPADDFYMVISGTIALQTMIDGEPFVVQTVVEGEEIGWSALAEEGFRHFTAKATSPVRVLVFNGPALRAACERNPQFGFVLMKHLLHLVAERLDHARMQLVYARRAHAIQQLR